MIFETHPWKLIERHYPLTLPELKEVREEAVNSAMVAHAIMMWALAIQDTQEELHCRRIETMLTGW